MRNRVKKSIMIATAIVSLSYTAVSYAEEDTKEKVIYQSSFSDYTADGLAKGWSAPKYVLNGSNEVPSPGSDAKSVIEDDGNNVIKLSTVADSRYNDIIPFNEIISNGKLHISFDMKFDDYNGEKKSWMFLQLFNTSKQDKYLNNVPMNNYNGNDINDIRGHGYSLSSTSLMRIYFKEDEPILISKSGQWASNLTAVNKSVEKDTWHHFDFVLDVDKTSQQVWVDGDKVTEEPFTLSGNIGYSFKGMGFLHNVGGSSKYDNITVTHYTESSTVKILEDDLQTAGEEVRISLGFSEYLSRVPQNGDFVITNAYTGEAVTYSIESSDKRSAVLNITQTEPAKLNIAFKEHCGLSGVISDKLSSEKVGFYTNHQSGGTMIPVLDQVSGVDYSGNSVSLDGEVKVPTGTTSVNVAFSASVDFTDAEHKIYIENQKDFTKLSTNLDVAADNKSVKLNLAELMEADTEYKLVIDNTLTSAEDTGVQIAQKYEFTFTTSGDSGFGIFGEKLLVESDTAKFTASIIKSDDEDYCGTMIICGYGKEEVNGVTYSKLKKVNIVKYDIKNKGITSYETKISGLDGIDTIKCFVNDMDTQKSLYVTEKAL